MLKLALGLFVCGLLAFSAEAPGVTHWSAASMKGWAARLTPKLDAQHVATERVGSFGRYYVLAAMRNGTGQAELHETDADIFMVQSGEATLVTGGTIVDAKTTQPHEVRGSAIKGGRDMKVAAGDVVTIPPKTPHWMKLEPGKEIVYMAVKIAE
jgi:mannose-6-phosphate isomerase-like protein (cupin superfamily)